MMTNLEYFQYAQEHPEPFIDPFYAKNMIVIPDQKGKTNNLTQSNSELLKFISAYSVLQKMQGAEKAKEEIVEQVIQILTTTSNINYTPFVQFFMVYNSNYSMFLNYSLDKKKELIQRMLEKYCVERHDMYLSHGYSDIVMQVMCDNYSHKRNSKTGIDKCLGIISPYLSSQDRLTDANKMFSLPDYYILPDKGDRHLFDLLLEKKGIEMKSRQGEQDKLPDLVLKHNNHFYFFEFKTMKQGGGGQDKQIVELIQFISYTETNSVIRDSIHYVAFLDCNYSNEIFTSKIDKVKKQKKGIEDALEANKGNYFLNTKAMILFIKNVFSS